MRHCKAPVSNCFPSDALRSSPFIIFTFLLAIACFFNHFGTLFLLFLNRLYLLHVVLSLRLADFGLGELKLGEHHLHAAGGAEVDGVENFGKI